MPIYEYRCQACGIETERQRSIGDRYLASCPFCGARLTLLMSPPSIAKAANPFTKDGEGFSSRYMSIDEATQREKAHASKYE